MVPITFNERKIVSGDHTIVLIQRTTNKPLSFIFLLYVSLWVLCCCCRPTPPCLSGCVLPCFEVMWHQIPVSTLEFRWNFIWNCSYISKKKWHHRIKGAKARGPPFRSPIPKYIRFSPSSSLEIGSLLKFLQCVPSNLNPPMRRGHSGTTS